MHYFGYEILFQTVLNQQHIGKV